MARVLVLDRDRLSAGLVGKSLTTDEGLQVVGSVSSLEEVVRHIESDSVDMVAARVGLSGRPALALMYLLRERGSGPQVVAYGVPDSPPILLRYLEAGARCCIPADAEESALPEALTAVADRRTPLSPEITYHTISRLSELARLCDDSDLDSSRLRALTDREREVLQLIGRRRTNRQIADELGIEIGTVKNHVHAVLGKLGVSNREDAARYLLLAEYRFEGPPTPSCEA